MEKLYRGSLMIVELPRLTMAIDVDVYFVIPGPHGNADQMKMPTGASAVFTARN